MWTTTVRGTVDVLRVSTRFLIRGRHVRLGRALASEAACCRGAVVVGGWRVLVSKALRVSGNTGRASNAKSAGGVTHVCQEGRAGANRNINSVATGAVGHAIISTFFGGEGKTMPINIPRIVLERPEV